MIKIKILFPLILLVALAAIPVHAQGSEPPIPSTPQAGEYVLDQLGWLTGDQESSINSIIQGLDHDGVAEIAVVTIDDCGSDKRTFRKSLFDSWGIGHADDNDGLLILVCWYGGDASRRSVEQLYGRGLNGVLTSSRTDQIAQENFISAFERGKPGDGLLGMIRSYNVLLRTAGGSSRSSNPLIRFYENLSDGTKETLFLLLCLPIILGLNYLISNRSGRHPSLYDRDTRDGGDFGGGGSDGGGGSSTRF